MGKKNTWECESCEDTEKCKDSEVPSFCECGGDMYLIKAGSVNKKRMRRKRDKKALRKMLETFFDVDLSESALSVCECKGQQERDVPQKVAEEPKDNVQCIVCGDCKQPELFIGDGVCHSCHDKQHGEHLEEINQGHYLEIMDRVHIIQYNLDDFVFAHPAIDRPGIEENIIRRKIEDIQDELMYVYQWAGQKWDNFDK